jgi:predicted kinase
MAQPGGVLTLLEQPVVVVLVGAAGSGKTTFRRSLVAAGYDAGRVVSLDDLRRCERAADAAAGRPVRSLQDYSLRAVRRAQRRCDALAGFGAGYLADATHLRRRERMAHVRVAADCGLPAVAVLLPDLTLATLLHRDAERPPDERVPTEVLAKQAHRRSLLSVDLLAGEGFAEVLEGTRHSFYITA